MAIEAIASPAGATRDLKATGEAARASVPISLVAHHVFCPRRAWLELQGEKTDTEQVAIGVRDHVRVDDDRTSDATRKRGVEVTSTELGVHGRCDTVEVRMDGSVELVEHKANPRRRSSRPSEANCVQLALQAMCLEEEGQTVGGASVWFASTRRKARVELTDELRNRARREVEATRAVQSAQRPPPPLEDDDRCRWCSHVSVCLPDEHRGPVRARRIGVGDPLGAVVHLTTPGSRAHLRRGRIEVVAQGAEAASTPLEQVCGLVVHGNADVSSALLREMLARGFPIVWCSWSGKVIGLALPAAGPNGQARIAQHHIDREGALQTAKEIVRAKILNERYVLRRYRLEGRETLKQLADRTKRAGSIEELIGVEGVAARIYFQQLDQAFVPEWASLDGRHGRAARNAVNAALNVAYGLLLADVIRAIATCGLDPYCGVMHTATGNKPALALDLMEEFRPLVAESSVLWAINNGELREKDAVMDLGRVRLTEQGRKRLIATYERRITSEFSHPIYRYKVTWRRAMEIQARVYMGVVCGEIARFRGIALR